jgi:hypothetical protein
MKTKLSSLAVPVRLAGAAPSPSAHTQTAEQAHALGAAPSLLRVIRALDGWSSERRTR